MFPVVLLLLSFFPRSISSPLLERARVEFNDSTQTACVHPAPWTQILTFFITNYIARVVTYKKTSGYEGRRDYFYVFASLFVPFVGISSAAATIARGSRFLGHTDVDRALLAEALCVIVREPGWRPEHGEIIRGCIIHEGDSQGRRKMRRRRRRRKSRGPRDTPELLGNPMHAYEQAAGGDSGTEHEGSDLDEKEFHGAGRFTRSSATLWIAPPDETKMQYIESWKYKIQGNSVARREGRSWESGMTHHVQVTFHCRHPTVSPNSPQVRS
jgi:hypothetical protein